VLVGLGWFTVPLVRLIYKVYFKMGKEDESDPFDSSHAFFLASFASQMAQLACLVYIIDCSVIVFDVANPNVHLREFEISRKFSKIIYTSWAAFRLMKFKRYLLSLAVQKKSKKLGKVGVYDRILDILILFSLATAMLGILEIDIGPGLVSLFAFGGVGTLVISLACKDFASQLVCGVVVSTSENFYVGDNIRVGNDKTCGIIDNIGWLYTDVRGKYMDMD
jgi:small-conductance mechanosensitive channel